MMKETRETQEGGDVCVEGGGFESIF